MWCLFVVVVVVKVVFDSDMLCIVSDLVDMIDMVSGVFEGNFFVG